MISRLGQSRATTLRRPLRRDPIGEHDPAKLSAALRELAIKAHRLVRDETCSASERMIETTARSSVGEGQSLREVHAQIVQLQKRLRAQNLDELVAYVSALRERVEEQLD